MARSNVSTRPIVFSERPLWQHQEQTATFCSTRPRVFDTSDPGTGKTRAHIEVYRQRKDRKRLLVVCPSTLMWSAWGADIEKYAPELTVSYATAGSRNEAFEMKTDVVIINTDGVTWFDNSSAIKKAQAEVADIKARAVFADATAKLKAVAMAQHDLNVAHKLDRPHAAGLLSAAQKAFSSPAERDTALRRAENKVKDEKAEANKRIAYLSEFDHLIVDEFTAFKHHTSQRAKALAEIRKFFTHRYLLSGTPNPNSVMELWHPAMILDDGKRLGTSYFKLRGAVQSATQTGPGINHVRWDDKPGAQQAVHELLADITIRHAFEDVMTHVPANHRSVREFKLNAKATKQYQQMERDCLLAFEDQVISAVHAASLRSKLLQIASGAVYSGEEGYAVLDTARYELVADLVEERAHSVVFFNWKHQRDLLAKEFDKRDVRFAIIDGDVPQRERDEIVAAYQRGEYQTILLHPKTGAHGLTLTRGDTTIVVSPFYEADLLKQGIHRIYRGDQDKVTNTILVQASGTVEDAVYDRLNGKYERMTDLLELMRQRSRT